MEAGGVCAAGRGRRAACRAARGPSGKAGQPAGSRAWPRLTGTVTGPVVTPPQSQDMPSRGAKFTFPHCRGAGEVARFGWWLAHALIQLALFRRSCRQQQGAAGKPGCLPACSRRRRLWV